MDSCRLYALGIIYRALAVAKVMPPSGLSHRRASTQIFLPSMLVTDAVHAMMHLVGRGCTGQKQCQAKAHVMAPVATMAGPYCIRTANHSSAHARHMDTYWYRITAYRYRKVR